MLATYYYRNIIKNMKKLLASFVLLITLYLQGVAGAVVPSVVIVEVQTESVSLASEEFIAIANNSTSTVSIVGWRLQYFSASTTNFTSPTRTIVLSGALEPGQQFIAASTGYKTADAKVFFTPTLSSAGGHVRLVSGNGTSEYEHDRFGWGTAVLPEGTAANLVAKDITYKRRRTGTIFIDTNNNRNDFLVTDTATPVSSVLLGATGLKILITELLPDPVSPLSDASDEYIELYNPGNGVMSLAGYTLQTGTNYSYTYTFKNETLPANGYIVFYSAATNLSLSNTAGGARLLGPDQNVIAESAKYDKAPTGKSWQLYGGSWSWGEQSAGYANTLVFAADTNPSSSTTKTTTTKAVKPKAAAKSTTTKAVTAGATTTKQAYQEPDTSTSSLPANPLVLAGVGVVAVVYMIYEYRQDIANKFRRRRTDNAISK
jgi:hypothetical protein